MNALKKEHQILVVDDDINIERLLGRILETVGVDMVFAEDGEEALEKVISNSRPFSMVISDQVMPGMKGHELLEKVRDLYPDTIRFILTGYTDLKIIIKAVNQGAIHRYIVKPCDQEFLAQQIKKGLADYEIIQENQKLLKLAKMQNMKLYKFYQSLLKKTSDHQNQILKLDVEINQLSEKIHSAKNRSFSYEDHIVKSLIREIENAGIMMDEQNLRVLMEECILELKDQVEEIAARNDLKFAR